MSQEIKGFFTLSENIQVLRSFHKKLKALENIDSNLTIFVEDLAYIIHFMLNDGQFFDEACRTNIEWVGQGFISEMQQFNDKKNTATKAEDNLDISIKSIFTTAYRFLCEADFCSPNGLNPELSRIKLHVDQKIDLFTGNDKSQLIYANYLMPAHIAKRLINLPSFKEIQSYNEKYANAEKLKSEWNDDISKKELEVVALKNKLEEYKTGFNFVGLFKGFDDLSSIKNTEQSWALVFLIVLAILAIVPVGAEIYLLIFKTETIKKYYLDLLKYAIFPTLTLQIVLVYFFRVALFNYKSVKAQCLQLELRKTLCQFIQSYSTYAKEMKTADNSSLEKFENLIFSGIIANEENLPSTFDGLEQLGKIIQSIKSPN
jgi:hypothetical protein